MDQVEGLRNKFYKKGLECGAREIFLNYIWDNLFNVQMGYSFSSLHTNAYSIIAIQQMNLNYHYPSIYWAAARLMVESGAVDFLEEDLDLLEADDESETKNNSVNYFKMSSAIGKIRGFGIQIEPPNINKSNFTFRVDEESNSIFFGLKGITRIGSSLIEEIIANRPYRSLEDFLSKVKVNKIQATMLIKAGAFDDFGDRAEMLYNYCDTVANKKSRITLQNMNQLIQYGIIEESLKKEINIWRFTKYLRANAKFGDLYVLKDGLASTAEQLGFTSLKQDESGSFYVEKKVWDKFYTGQMGPIRNWMNENQEEILSKLNTELVQELLEKYAVGSIADQEMEALSYYYSYHAMETEEYSTWLNSLGVESFFDLPEEPTIAWERGQAKMFELTTIAGTAIGRDKQKRIVGLSTPDGFVKLKVYRAQFVKFDRQIKIDGEIEKSWFSKGTKLLIQGYRNGDYFIPKYYKNSTLKQAIYKINEPGSIVSERLGESI
jgi:DNA polymerase-3 subunit alpha